MIEWLTIYASIVFDLADDDTRILIASGRSRIKMPDDIFEMIKGQLSIGNGFYYMIVELSFDQTIIRIEGDSTLKTSIELIVDNG